MPESPAPPDFPATPRNPLKPHSHFNNWISAIGAVLSAGALFSFTFLVWMDFSQGEKNPYLGILTYLVVPVFLITGIVLILFGAWAQRRWAVKHTAHPDRWQLDFGNPRQRRLAIGFGSGGVLFLVLSAFGSYQTYHYSESNQFCGEVCHSAMEPEYVAYKRGSHARVDCVECHIGSGAEWFVKAKINGVNQLVSFVFDSYNRPIETPLTNLRPAQEICEQCHWPEKFHGNIEINFDHFLSDRDNTPYTARMLMHVNKSAPGSPLGGIHWHVSETERVEYYATDDKRNDIPWMRVTNLKDGTHRVFRTEEFTGEPPPDQIRVMDCMDCHNRPAHVFPTANDIVEKAMAQGSLTTGLPNIKRVAVQAMTETEIATSAEAPQKIADFLRSKYNDRAHAVELPGAIAAVQALYATSIFPERKADWRVYPNHIGHKDWPGCFRCHDDRHKTAQGQLVRSSDCNSCHTILAQGKGNELQTLSAGGMDFAHPGGELDPDLTCADCHNGGVQ